MNREDILKELEGYNYTIYGKQYAVVDSYTDEGDYLPLDWSGFIEHGADAIQGARSVVVISLDTPFEDVEDVCEALNYCECYTGQ